MTTTRASPPVVICASCGATNTAVEGQCAAWQVGDPTQPPDPGWPAVWMYLRCSHCGSTALAPRLLAFRPPER